MKKLLGILVLGLLWCNIGLAQIVILRCEGVSLKKMEKGELKEKPINYYSIFKINLEENFYERDEDGVKNYFINTDDKLMWYGLFPMFGEYFYMSESKLSRITGEWRYTTISNLSVADYKRIKKELDEINKSIKNYKPYLDMGDERYKVDELSSKNQDKELKKFGIIEKEISALATNNTDHLEGYWQCKKQQKAF